MSTRPKRNAFAPDQGKILSYLDRRGKPASQHNLFQAFAIRKGPSRDELIQRLQAMVNAGQIMVDRRERYFLPNRANIIRGRIIGHPDGYGFLSPETGGEDLYLPAKEMRKVLHGDKALAKLRHIDHRGRNEGTIIEVIERANETVVGRLYIEDQMCFLVPDDKRINQDIFIPKGARGGANHRQIVTVEITRHPNKHSQPIGRVIEILGEHLEPGMEVEIAVRKYAIPFEWSSDVDTEVSRLPQAVEKFDERLDLRHLPLITIDGEDARDFDDAVYARKVAKGWELIVAIADVSHYVVPNTALDQEAFHRGNSVYFPQRVVPMLPEFLSNGLCSLNPDVDRLCFACMMDIDKEGEIGQYRFESAIMRSHARLTYTQVANALAEADPQAQIADLLPHLQCLYRLSQVLHNHREDSGIDLDLPETKILFDEGGKIEQIQPSVRNDAHRLIEECMLAANRCAADILVNNKSPGIYRIHEQPDTSKIDDLRGFLEVLGLNLGGGLKPSAEDYAKVVENVQGQSYATVVQTTLLRSLSQARYSADLGQHFALGFERYTHFTSPIRRYPDLIIHRLIKHVLGIQRDVNLTSGVAEIAEHCSVTERRAEDATRDVIQWLKAEFMRDKVGEVFDGVINSVVEFGIFVELDELHVEGLVHVTALGEDYFHYDPVMRYLVGEHSGEKYQLGSKVRVRVVRVDLDRARIDFELVDYSPTRKKAKVRRKSKPKRPRR